MPDWTPLGAQFLFCSNQKKFQATIGQFQRLKTIEHPYLAQYIDLQRGANGKYNMATFADHILDADRLFVISQQPQERVRELNQRHIAQLVLALDYLNQQGIVHHALSPSSLGRFCGELLLCDWGLFHMTDRGRNVLFPVPDLRYTAPEYIYCLSGRDCSFNPRVSAFMLEINALILIKYRQADVWSLGMLLLEQKLGRNILSGSENQFERESDIERLLTEMRGLEYKLADGAFLDGLLTAVESEDCRDFIKSCLIFDPLQRPAPLHLLNHPYISRIVEMLLPELTPNSIRSFTRVPLPFNVRLNKDIADQVKFGLQLEPMCSLSPTETDPLYSVPLSYLYYMWRLTGGNLETELSRTKRVPMPLPSVERIPRIIRSSAKSNRMNAEFTF
jgi:serine/threonine protein kinase